MILPYLFALAMAAGLACLGYRNRGLGPRRPSAACWLKIKPLEELPANRPNDRATFHLGALEQLNSALVSHSALRNHSVTHPR
jgi:hypothetical protein